MKIFVAYGYNDRDSWIVDQVFPLIHAFGFELETGELTYDGDIPDSVKNKIMISDALIGFRTRRGDSQNGKWPTHRWVTEELAMASIRNKKLLEVRESNVDDQGGVVGNHQYIEYDETSRDKFLVELVAALGLWNRSRPITVRLKLKDVTDDQFHNMLDGLSCRYNLKQGNFIGEPVVVDVIPEPGGFFVGIPSNGPDTLVRIELKYGPEKWKSIYSPLNLCGIDLKKIG